MTTRSPRCIGSRKSTRSIEAVTTGARQCRNAEIAAFRSSLAGSGIRAVVSHDSYLINLASPDEALRTKSIGAFTGELHRSRTFGIPWVVSHPGNYIDDRAAGLARNSRGYAQCLAAVSGEVGVLIEGTAGAGTALGSTFEALRALRDALPAGVQARVGFVVDPTPSPSNTLTPDFCIEAVEEAIG